jgi:hypothetical protein
MASGQTSRSSPRRRRRRARSTPNGNHPASPAKASPSQGERVNAHMASPDPPTARRHEHLTAVQVRAMPLGTAAGQVAR